MRILLFLSIVGGCLGNCCNTGNLGGCCGSGAILGNGAFHAIVPETTAAGQLPFSEMIYLSPPPGWGSHGFLPNAWHFTDWQDENTVIDMIPYPHPPYDNKGIYIADRVDIEFVSVTTELPHIAASSCVWAPFNQYPSRTWAQFDLLPAFVKEGTILPLQFVETFSAQYANLALVTSTPPCLFSVSVAEGGRRITFFVAVCAPTLFGLFDGVFMMDMLTIHLPWAYLSTNPEFPQLMVQMHATFHVLSEVQVNVLEQAEDGTLASVEFLASYNVTGPLLANLPWLTTVPELALSSLQFMYFFPGDPEHGIPINTITGKRLDALTIAFQLGVQLQAGGRIAVSTSIVPLLTFDMDLQVINALLGNHLNQGLPFKITPPEGIIWATTPATVPFAVGPGCKRWLGSVDCCSQTVGRILLPFPSTLTYPAWWTTFVMELGPPGCVLPADKKMVAVIPKEYLGRNPLPTDILATGLAEFIKEFILNVENLVATSQNGDGGGNGDGSSGSSSGSLGGAGGGTNPDLAGLRAAAISLGKLLNWPGYVHVDARMMTIAEGRPAILQRFSESHPLAHVGNWPAGYLQQGGGFAFTPQEQAAFVECVRKNGKDCKLHHDNGGGNDGRFNPGGQKFRPTAANLSPLGPGFQEIALGEAKGLENRMFVSDLALVLGPSSYVVGPSVPQSLVVKIDNNVAGAQPLNMRATLTFSMPLKPRPHPETDTYYWIVLTANQGVFRPNVASLEYLRPMVTSAPLECQGALMGFTSAYGTLFIGFSDARCIAALCGDDPVISWQIPSEMLLPNPAAGSKIYFDVRLVPVMETRLYGREFLGITVDQWILAELDNILANLDIEVAQALAQLPSIPIPYGGAVVKVDTAALMYVYGYTTVVECGTMTFLPSAVGDMANIGHASRCYLVNAISQISPVSAGFLQCNPGANVNNAQSLVTFVKIAEGSWSATNWPNTNSPHPVSTWPQDIGLPGTPPVFVTNWGVMYSVPMFAVAVSYPPIRQNLQALGVNPSVPNSWQVAFIVRIDRLTSACSVVNLENPWSFCVAVGRPVVNVLHFPAIPVWTWWSDALNVNPTTAGIPVEGTTHGSWGNSKLPPVQTEYGHVTTGVCITVISDGAVAGWYSNVGASVNVDDDESSPAWYAFFALFAVPLLCLLCLLAWWLLRRPKAQPCCCPMEPDATVQEMYWVNAQPSAFMIQPVRVQSPPAMAMPMMGSPMSYGQPIIMASPPMSPMGVRPSSPLFIMK